jgi:hypothetical protein
MLEARVAALKEENPKLLAFYKSLTRTGKRNSTSSVIAGTARTSEAERNLRYGRF